MMGFIKRRIELLNRMDPHRIYIENVRALFSSSERFARWLCGKACTDGFLDRWYSFENPATGRSLYECEAGTPIDESITVHDDVAEQLGEPHEFKLNDLKKVEFYRRGYQYADT